MKKINYFFLLAFVAFPIVQPALCRADEPLDLSTAQFAACTAVPDGSGLKIDFSAASTYPNVHWNVGNGQGWDWSGYSGLEFTLTNPASTDQAFDIRLDSEPSGTDKDNIIQSEGTIGAGKTQTYYLAFTAAADPKAKGMDGAPPVPDAGTSLYSGALPNVNNVTGFQIFLAQPKTDVTLVLQSIGLSHKSYQPNYEGLVDQYGQFTGAEWPGKVLSDSDFSKQKQAEIADLRAHPGILGRDKWGGWANGQVQTATGFFYTKKINGKWWLVDPDGRLFLSAGVDCVDQNCTTQIGQRETLFKWLPAAGDPLAAFYSDWGGPTGKQYDFFAANKFRKFGPHNDLECAEIADARLISWGFNTIGNWSNQAVIATHKVPYAATGNVSGDYKKLHTMADPYDPAFAQAAESCLGPLADQTKNDPYCLGYFVDNELPWAFWDPSGKDDSLGLAISAFALDAGSSPAKTAFLTLLKAKYAVISNLNSSWGTNFANWDAMNAPITLPTSLTPGMKKDMSDCEYDDALHYYTVIRDTLKRHDPNHLYLGSRLAMTTREVTLAASKVCDVVSFNIYRDKIEEEDDFETHLDVPCLIGEFHFGALDRGMFSGGMRLVKDQEDRAAHYTAYVADLFNSPQFVGCHWFQYTDEPTTGRSDGENYNIGFVSVTDTPYPDLVNAARKMNAQIYAIHSATQITAN